LLCDDGSSMCTCCWNVAFILFQSPPGRVLRSSPIHCGACHGGFFAFRALPLSSAEFLLIVVSVTTINHIRAMAMSLEPIVGAVKTCFAPRSAWVESSLLKVYRRNSRIQIISDYSDQIPYYSDQIPYGIPEFRSIQINSDWFLKTESNNSDHLRFLRIFQMWFHNKTSDSDISEAHSNSRSLAILFSDRFSPLCSLNKTIWHAGAIC
jgi:hypothetical protein